MEVVVVELEVESVAACAAHGQTFFFVLWISAGWVGFVVGGWVLRKCQSPSPVGFTSNPIGSRVEVGTWAERIWDWR